MSRWPIVLDSGRRARLRSILVASSRGHRRIDVAAVDRLVAIWIRLAGGLGGRTFMRTLAAAATRGTSTFVHAAMVE
jgi:hypothetical protein